MNTLLRCILFILFLQVGSPALARVVDKKELRKIQQEMDCLLEVGVAHDVLEVARERALSAREDSVASAFRLFSEQHQKFLDALDSYTADLKGTTGAQNLKDALARFYAGQRAVEAEYEFANLLTRRFLAAADVLGELLVQAERRVDRVQTEMKGCSSSRPQEDPNAPGLTTGVTGSKVLASELKKELASWLPKLGVMREFVSASHTKRRALFSGVSSELRFDLERRYAESVGTELVKLRDEIDGTFAALDFQDQMEQWVIRNTGPRSTAALERGRYMQFEPALKAWNQVQVGHAKLVDQLNKSPFPAGIKSTLTARLVGVGSTIKKEIEKLTTGGWTAQFERQQAHTKALAGAASQLPAACRQLITSHLQLGPRVQTIESFRITEALYKKMIKECQL